MAQASETESLSVCPWHCDIVTGLCHDCQEEETEHIYYLPLEWELKDLKGFDSCRT